MKYWQAVNTALHEEMARDETVCYLGEDVGLPGGPFAASRGLLDAFGPRRVRDTPISEATFVGAALGAAMSGLRPVVEVMFFDFITIVMDQLVNQAAKVRYMSGGAFSAPMTIRTMCGAGRGSGPQHSQSLEAWLGHVPGIKVVRPANPQDAQDLLKAAIRDDNPVVVIDDITMWTDRGDVVGTDEVEPLGTGRIARPGNDVTLAAWGSAVKLALAGADELANRGIEAEVLDLRSINPLDQDLVIDSVRRTGRLAIAHHAVSPYGPGAEVAAVVAERAWDALRAPVARVSPPFAPVPFSKDLESAYYPSVDDLVSTATTLAGSDRPLEARH